MAKAEEAEGAYWHQPIDQLLAALESGEGGLASGAAKSRLERFGPNRLTDDSRIGALGLLLRQFESPLVIILIVGALVSLGLKEWVDAGIILAIVLGSALLGFWQEHRASAAVAELKKRLTLTCRVLRDGKEAILAAADLVPGDVVLLSAGNLVPADGRLVDAKDFLVSQASLTGESFPVEKQPGDAPAQASLAQRRNCAFQGSSVRSGWAKLLIVRTGRQTEFGAIAEHLRRRAPENEFQRGLRQFGQLLLRIMILTILFVVVVNTALGRPEIDSLLFAIALAVGLSPELLPAIVSVTLSAGARALAGRGVIVRRLDAIENLGAIDVLCTDKTGTLTEGVVSLTATPDRRGRDDGRVRRLAYLNAALESGIENPLDEAIVRDGQARGIGTAGVRKIDEIPYDFSRRALTIVVAEETEAAPKAETLLITKGAFTQVLARCTKLRDGDEVLPLDGAARVDLDQFFQAQGKAGFRTLALATRTHDAKAHYDRDDERDMTFEGFLLFSDPPKSGVEKTLRHLTELGIAIKVITGDNRHVAQHLAARIGLAADAILTGEELAGMRDEALWHAAERTQLFVEVDPQQKERIVRALQKTGHAVGYLGDGINDAPSLHAADVGISVEKAVDVAREAADVVLLKPDLDVLCQGVLGGRRTFANTLKYIAITTSANFGNMLSMALATPFLTFLPLLPKQILLNNFLSDLPSIAISTDRVDEDQLNRAQRWSIKDVRRFMIVFGLISSLFDLVTFAFLLWVLGADEATFQALWFVVSLLTELLVVLVLRTRGAAWKSRPGRLLLWSSVITAMLSLALPQLGLTARLFGFEPLTLSESLIGLSIVVAYVATTEACKRRFFRHR